MKTASRDFRIDFFRGLALLMIFVDHVPQNPLSSITLKHLGFSDAAEVFVLLAGISSALAYRSTFIGRGWLAGAARVLKRCWTIYVAHLLMLLVVAALIVGIAGDEDGFLFLDEFNLAPLFSETQAVLGRVLTLRYLPNYLDILPLYVVLLAAVPLLLPQAERRPRSVLVISTLLYLAAQHWEWNLPSYPAERQWFLNPFAWQLLFVIGLVVGLATVRSDNIALRKALLLRLALGYLAFGILAAAPWQQIPGLESLKALPDWLIPDPSKTNLSPWRLANVLAQVYVVAHFMPRETALSRDRLARIVACIGSRGLEAFFIATVLSFLVYLVPARIGDHAGMQVTIILACIMLISGAAMLLSWLRRQTQAQGQILGAAGVPVSGTDLISRR